MTTNTTTAKKLTKRDIFTAILESAETIDLTAIDERITAEALKAFAQNEIDLLNKKSSAERKPTAKDTENASLKELILSVMDSTPATVSDIQKRNETLSALSNQKVSVLIRQLCEEGVCCKVEEKRKSLFAIV